jgi:hypothetical protein
LTGGVERVVLSGGRFMMTSAAWVTIILLAALVVGEFGWIIRVWWLLRRERMDSARLRDLIREMQTDGKRPR